MLKINISPPCQQDGVVMEAVASPSDIELKETRSTFQLSSQPRALYNSRRQLYFAFSPQTVLIHLGDGEARKEERTARLV